MPEMKSEESGMAAVMAEGIQQRAEKMPGPQRNDSRYPIRLVAVLGAGTMGARIAAHVANAGFPVVLLDRVPDGATDHNQLAQQAVEALKKSKPAAFVAPEVART